MRDTAAFFREAEQVYRNLRLPPVGDVTRPGPRAAPGRRGHRGRSARGASPEVAELTLKTAALLEELGHQVEPVDHAAARRPSPTTSSSTGRCSRWSSSAAGRRSSAGPGTPAGSTTSPTASPARAAATCTGCRGAIARLRRIAARVSRRFFEQYDVAAHARRSRTETPLVGHLDPTQDYDTIMDRLLDWVAFTPLQNATGDPAISLPLATTAAGLPQGMMFAAGAGREATLLELAYELEEARPWARIRRLNPGRPEPDGRQPISRTLERLCSVLRRCPFSSVGRASPW